MTTPVEGSRRYRVVENGEKDFRPVFAVFLNEAIWWS
jgi:hypothetical protein